MMSDSLELARFNKATFAIVLESVLYEKGGDFLVIFICGFDDTSPLRLQINPFLWKFRFKPIEIR